VGWSTEKPGESGSNSFFSDLERRRMSMVISDIVLFIVVISLYAIRIFLYRKVSDRKLIIALFCCSIILVLPVIWFFSPDWNNPDVLRISNWVGTPIIVLGVPYISFLVDIFRFNQKLRPAYVRFAIEIFVGVPLWAYVWVLIELFILGWIRI
jgi:hypothetical protein